MCACVVQIILWWGFSTILRLLRSINFPQIIMLPFPVPCLGWYGDAPVARLLASVAPLLCCLGVHALSWCVACLLAGLSKNSGEFHDDYFTFLLLFFAAALLWGRSSSSRSCGAQGAEGHDGTP